MSTIHTLREFVHMLNTTVPPVHTVERVTQREYLQALAAKGFTRIPEWITIADMLDLYRQIDNATTTRAEPEQPVDAMDVSRWQDEEDDYSDLKNTERCQLP